MAGNLIKNRGLSVGIGVKVEIEVNGEPQSWEIVNIGESDIPNGKISCNAPLVQCLLGAAEGDRMSCKIFNSDVKIIIKKVLPSII